MMSSSTKAGLKRDLDAQVVELALTLKNMIAYGRPYSQQLADRAERYCETLKLYDEEVLRSECRKAFK